MRMSQTNNKGFSYLELLLVMAIIIIIASVVRVRTDSILSKNNTNIIAKQLCSHIYYVQQKAIEENRSWVIKFVDGSERDEYHIYPTGEQDKPREVIDISEKYVFWGDNNNNYKPEQIEFNHLGAPLGNGLIIGLNNSKEGLYIKIASVTGRTKILNEIE